MPSLRRMGFLLSLATAGCQAPNGAMAAAEGPNVEARIYLAQPRYQLLATLTQYRKSLHHVNVRVYKRAQDLSYPSTPIITSTLPGSQLTEPLVLKYLKMGETYRFNAEGFLGADESGATRVSIPQNSQAELTVPSLAMLGGVAQVQRTLTLRVPLDLLNQTYDGQASFKLTVTGGRIDNVRMTLLGVTPSVTKTYTAPYAASYPINNLKLGTTYTLQAEGIQKNGKVATTSTINFTTPSIDPVTGKVSTDVPGPISFALN